MQLVFVILFILLPGFIGDFWNKYGSTPPNDYHQVKPSYPDPHRDPKTGKIVIENSQQYYEDVRNHGAYQAQQWVKQGKYNLTAEELEKEEDRLRKKYEYLYKL